MNNKPTPKSVSLTMETWEAIDKLALAFGMNRSAMIKRIVDEWIAGNQPKKGKK